MADQRVVSRLRKPLAADGAMNVPQEWKRNLRRADLQGVDLTGAELAGADLSRADLHGANLTTAILTDVVFHGANLTDANLSAANLAGANFRFATLTRANFNGADLQDTYFREADSKWTVYGDVDLSMAKGLDRIRHSGPSVVSIGTLLKSGGKLPAEFLRGCGIDPLVQDILTGSPVSRTEGFTYWLSKIHRPFQRCFISYATEDKAFVERLQRSLNATGVDYWYAPEHGKWGAELHKQIDQEISLRDRMLLVCSHTSLQKDWVKYEIERAVAAEQRRGERVIFPIMIDDALSRWTHPYASRIREVLAADFREALKGKAFKKALRRLVAALMPEPISMIVT